MIWAGKIIEYIEQGKFICAMVMEDAGKRLRLLNQNGREVNLPVSRVVHQTEASFSLSMEHEALTRQLKDIDQSRTVLMQEIVLADIWQLAAEEEGQGFTPRFLAELTFGEDAGDDHVAAFLRAVFMDRLYFKYKEGMVYAHAPEAVEQLQAKLEKEREKEALLTSGAKGVQALWEGDGSADWPERLTCLDLVRDYYLFGNEAAEAETARALLKKAGLTGPHDPFHLLVKAGVWHKDENVALLRYAIPVDFSEEVLAEAAVPEPELDELLALRRKNFCDLPLLTIDGAATRDYDDALHIERCGEDFLVGIHISDVSLYVKPGTALYDEASRRMTSIYFPEDQIPMLPRQLSEGVCSLIAGKVRAALSVLVQLSPQGAIKEFEIVPSVVRVQRKLTYIESDGLVETDPDLRDLAMLSEQLRQRRIEAGALILPVPDVEIRFDADGEVAIALSPVDTVSRSMVAEFMVLANTLAAQFVADRQAPGLFRAQAEPHQRLIGGSESDLYSILRQRKQLKPGELLTHAKPHSGVGVMQYTTVTSPIRRFLDLVMQHQINTLMRGRGPMYREDELAGIAGEIGVVLPRVNQVARQRQRYWLLRYLEARVGQRLQALIVNKGPKRINLVLLDCLMDIDMPPNQGIGARPGDVVSVRLAKVNALDNLLRVEW